MHAGGCRGRLAGEHDTNTWRVLNHYVESAGAEADCSDVQRVDLGETSSKRGDSYLGLFVDLEQARVLFAAKEAKQSRSRRFAMTSERTAGMRVG